MKIGKKAVMGISFMVGTIMFATTAFAEVSTKSGYEQAKDALKYSADVFSSKLQNYTINSSIIFKDNESIVTEKDKVSKYDFSKHAEENAGTEIESDGPKTDIFYYADKNTIIDYDSKNDVYNVINYNKPNNFTMLSNPFKEKQEGDLEKIADAIIGNLKDSVVVNQKTDGTKELSGNISESQIPAIANALVSYKLKNRYSGNDINDVYVKNANEDIILNKDGLIQSGSGSVEITYNDREGKVQDLILEIIVKVVDINTTKVNKPDLIGKKVKQSNVKENNIKLVDPQMYIGTYKNDIVTEKDGKFIKIGERILEITNADSKKIIGKYHEEYIKGYENNASDIKNVNFTATFKDQFDAYFQIIDSKGNKVNGNISRPSNSAVVNFGFTNSQDQLYNWQYNRVFN